MPKVCTVNSESENTDWMELGLCRQTDPEIFFPEKGGSSADAKRVCLGCDVRAECLAYALAHNEPFGIWGALSARERNGLSKVIQGGGEPTCIRCGEPHGGSPKRKYCDTCRSAARQESHQRHADRTAA